MKNYTWEYIQKYPKQTKRLLGIDYQQLEQLMALGKLIHRKNQSEIEKTKIRINQPGSGTPPKLSEEEQIVLMLVYLRHHLSFQILGLMFQVSESTAHNIFTYWQKLFEGELPPSLLEQIKKCQEEEIIIEQLRDYELIVDSAEQPVERPTDYQEQKIYYSGKQRRHTLKSQFIVLPKAEDIVDVVIGQPGPTSDIKICRETLSKFDSQQTFIGDKAYLGENQIRTPDKKPKNGELTENQIKENKVLSSRRIFVEHLISSGLIPRRSRRIIEKGSSVCVMQWTGVIRDRTLIEKDIGRFLSIVFDLERANHLNLLPDKDLVDLCHPIEPYQVTKSQEYLQLHQNLQLSLF